MPEESTVTLQPSPDAPHALASPVPQVAAFGIVGVLLLATPVVGLPQAAPSGAGLAEERRDRAEALRARPDPLSRSAPGAAGGCVADGGVAQGGT
jgi:hypothetical protein